MAATLAIEAFLSASGPIVDVRSPSEHAQGRIPGAMNVPLFSDEERAEVGTLYKQSGRRESIQRGLELVGPKLAQMGQQLCELSAGQPEPLRLHCWRGGMRSASVAWLAETLDLDVVLLDGGYKSFRRWVLQRFEEPWPIQLLGGGTGCGKTDVLIALAEAGGAMVDLEGLANHRGSSFGALGQPPQPSSEHFENCLALALERQRGRSPLWLEAESAQIGRCRLPHRLFEQMQQAPVVVLQRPTEERIAALVDVYGPQDTNGLLQATERLQRRLGPQRTLEATTCISQGDLAGACRVILEYYDRCYDHELSRRAPPLATLEVGGQSPDHVAKQLLLLKPA